MNDKPGTKDYLTAAVLASAVLVSVVWYADTPADGGVKNGSKDLEERPNVAFEEHVLPSEGVELPAVWDDLGAKMISAGVIDDEKFKALYQNREGLDEYMRGLLYGADNGKLRITRENSDEILNLLWALGLGNKNAILENGEMTDARYGGAGRFASTGGWTLAQGDAMDHYSRHLFFVLTPEQQEIVDRVSANIYRPCCGNSTHFPDCNHGMAMLGLLELMASQGVSEAEMYRVAMQVNAYWFPSNYLTIAKYLENQGSSWEAADPKEILGAQFSSSAGYKTILSKVTPPAQNSGGGCGV